MPFGRRPRKTAPARWINTRLEYGPSGKLIHQEGYWYKGVVAEAGGAFKDGADWQFQSDGAEDATGNLLGTVNTNPAKGLLVNSTVYFLRFGVEETNGGGWMNAAPILQYNKNSGGWTTVNASSANIQTAAGTPVDGVDTSQLITGFTHDPTNEGYDDVDGQAGGPSADLGNSGFECVFAFQIIDGDVADDDTIELRPVDSALAALRVYPQSWPTITVQKAAADTIIDVPEGTFALAGQLPAVGTGVKVDAPEGTFAFGGQVPAVGTGALVTLPSEQSFSLAGQVPTIETGVSIEPPAEVTFSLAGQVPAVGTGVLVTLPSENSFSLAGQVPAVGTGVKVDVPEGTFALSGYAPSVGGIFVAEGTFALAGQVPAVGTGAKVDAPEGTFAFGPQLPRVGTSALVDVPEGTFAFAGQVPAVGTSVDVQLPGEQAFVLTGQVPAVGTGVKVASPVNGFDLAGQIPEVDAGGAAEVLVPEGSFALAGQVPIINTGVNVGVPEQAYIFQGIDPTIAAGVVDDGHRRRVRTHWNE